MQIRLFGHARIQAHQPLDAKGTLGEIGELFSLNSQIAESRAKPDLLLDMLYSRDGRFGQFVRGTLGADCCS